MSSNSQLHRLQKLHVVDLSVFVLVARLNQFIDELA
jgi:hypothetical protein